MRFERAKKGFSLVEVMISISLFVLLIRLVVANTSFLHRYSVRAELDKMYSVFRYLQKVAIVAGQNQVLEFDIEKNEYWCKDRFFKLPAGVVFGVVPGAKGPPCAPKKNIVLPITFKKQKVTFHKDGIIKSGTIYLTDAKKTIMYAMSSSVAQVSYLRRYAYNQGWTSIR